MTPNKAYKLLGGLLLLVLSIAQLGVCARPHGTGDGQDLILATCKETLYVEVCVSSLGSDPRSRGADLEGLGAIALDLTMVHGSETISQMKRLNGQKNVKRDAYMAGCLRDCIEEYSDAVEDLRQSADAIKEKMYDTVNDMVSGAMTDSDTCEEAFNERPGYVSPLTERNQYFYKLCSNALSITKLLAS
ncbi:hypothetical protein AAC387_Pa09g2175 [Persea americana]